jgi:hypothetical protein
MWWIQQNFKSTTKFPRPLTHWDRDGQSMQHIRGRGKVHQDFSEKTSEEETTWKTQAWMKG